MPEVVVESKNRTKKKKIIYKCLPNSSQGLIPVNTKTKKINWIQINNFFQAYICIGNESFPPGHQSVPIQLQTSWVLNN